jgi:siroheme synthase
MGITGLDIIASQLQAAGLPNDTPAALIYRASWPNERFYPGTLATLPKVARDNEVKPPALIVIGSVLRLSGAYAVFPSS